MREGLCAGDLLKEAIMATWKHVFVESKLGNKFKIESKIGNHVLYVDQPRSGGGDDSGPTPLDYFFLSLAGCIATIGRIVANQKKIQLRGMEVQVEGEVDVETLLGKSMENRAGFTGLKVKVKIDADMTKEEKEQFLHEVDLRCPISDNIQKGTPVSFEAL